MQITKEMLSPAVMSQDDVAAFVARYGQGPEGIVLFAIEILGLEPDDNQILILQSLFYSDYISISSGRGIGKTYSISIIALWVLCTRPNAKVLVTSNTADQSKNTLWQPLNKILKASKVADWFQGNSMNIWFKGNPEGPNIQRLIWSEHNVEAVSGYHSTNMIYLCDEASKYPNVVIENLYASCTETWNKMFLFSNPTRNSGYFYDTAEKPAWTFHEIDSRSSKHTDKSKIQELIDENGEDSDVVRVQVLGKFPRLSATNIISDDIVRKSMSAAKPNIKANYVVSIGLDVGGGGDPSVWFIRIGLWCAEIVKLNTEDQETIISKSVQLVEKYKADFLCYDKTGIGHFLGGPLSQRVKQTCQVIGVQKGEASPEQDCVKKRDWIYRRFADWFKAGGVIGQRPEIRRQLLVTEFFYDINGKIKLILKELIKKELNGQSPNEADAGALSCGYVGDLIHQPFNRKISESTLASDLLESSKW